MDRILRDEPTVCQCRRFVLRRFALKFTPIPNPRLRKCCTIIRLTRIGPELSGGGDRANSLVAESFCEGERRLR